MIELSVEATTIIMLSALVFGIITGYYIAGVIGGVALIVGYAIWGPAIVELIYARVYGMLLNYILLAVPLFIFMGGMLEHSGITEKLYNALYLWLGSLRGGLALVTVLIGTIMAACVGIIAASITMLSLVALPSMISRGYSKSLATGSVCAGGCLGILIPPSIMLVVYGPMAGVSVGKLFFGAVGPGLLLSFLYCAYIAIRSFFQPNIAPAVPVEERKIPFAKKTTLLITSLLPAALLISAVLGVIFLGIAPPTEAAGVGAFASILLAAAYRRLSFRVLKEVSLATVRILGFVFLIFIMAVAFSSVFLGAGCGDFVKEIILSAPGGRWGVFAVTMLIVFIMGMFMDWLPIIFIVVPIITPIGAALGFDSIWFAIMLCVNLQMCFMTPPFAGAIFICIGSCPPELEVTMSDVIRGVIPFVVLIMIGITLCVFFPQIVLWLPGMMMK